MGLQYFDGRMVTEYCKVCSGTGFKVKYSNPVKFMKCWLCYGWRGRFSDRTTPPQVTPPIPTAKIKLQSEMEVFLSPAPR